ncbi:MAG: alpha/beta fold hydrolase, partial [Actinomycetota bacterium]|nr:alpha/beta fold hydrolase [Actinomycetota bacterium]
MTASLVLVHGAGSGPWVFDAWVPPAGLELVAVDLQEGLDVGSASMDDYSRVLVRRCERLPRPHALCGWSMGGLVAMMASEKVSPGALVL